MIVVSSHKVSSKLIFQTSSYLHKFPRKLVLAKVLYLNFNACACEFSYKYLYPKNCSVCLDMFCICVDA